MSALSNFRHTNRNPVRRKMFQPVGSRIIERSNSAEAKRAIMYQSSYAEQLEETPRECRDRERHAFDLAIELLQQAEKDGVSSSRSVHALHFVGRLWQALIEDLVEPDNDLPDMLRADLVSIGIWMIKEAEAIRLGQSSNFCGLIEICSIVRDGLR